MTRDTLGRRQLLTLGTAASLASSLLSPLDALGAEARVPRRVLGKTGQSIPILLLGGASGFDEKFDPRIAEALRFGVDYIDAARNYAGGKCELHAANTLERLNAQKKVWITSKSGDHSPAGFEANVKLSLEQLRRDSVDLYYLHAVDDPSPLDDKELFKVVERLKREGKIKYFGFSCHDGTVAELLHKAAGLSLIDSVMFRYNFRQYGDKALNLAMDAAHKAGIGLIAMKTQGAEASFESAWKKFEQTGKWTKHQSVLKAVWADPRITAAVSHMDNMGKLKENVAAALDKSELGRGDWDAIERYARATRGYACDGCSQICGVALPAGMQVGTTLRYLMYHDVYGEKEKAKALFAALPEGARRTSGIDFSAANRACPHGVDVAAHFERAQSVLA